MRPQRLLRRRHDAGRRLARSSAISSAFASATRSTVPTSSRCTGPTFVITPTSRLRDLRQLADLSHAAHRHLEHQHPHPDVGLEHGQRQPDLGVEVLAVRVHARRRTPGASIASRMSLVDVLPVEPVMPTTRHPPLAQPLAATRAPGRRAPRADPSASITRAPRSRRDGSVGDVRRARRSRPTRPASIAAAANRPPSARSPAQADEQVARADRARVDDGPHGHVVGRAGRRGPATSAPAGSVARSAAGVSRITVRVPDRAPQPAQGVARDLAVVERELAPALELLSLLVALARDHHDVARAARAAIARSIAARRSASTSIAEASPRRRRAPRRPRRSPR